MASAGIHKNRNGTRYQVWWRLDDGTQGSKTFDPCPRPGLQEREERAPRPDRRQLLDRTAPRSHPVRRLGRPLEAALVLQPTAQPRRHGDHRKPPTLSPPSLLRPPPAPPAHPLELVLPAQHELEDRQQPPGDAGMELAEVPPGTPTVEALRQVAARMLTSSTDLFCPDPERATRVQLVLSHPELRARGWSGCWPPSGSSPSGCVRPTRTGSTRSSPWGGAAP